METKLFINNNFVDSHSRDKFEVFNPATEELVANVSAAGAHDVEAAVDAAEKAFPGWRDLPVIAKTGMFKKLAELIVQHKDELWALDRNCMGRTYEMAQWEVQGCAGLFEMYGSAGFHIQGRSSLNTPGMITFTLRQPYGVVAGIIPWNVSLIMFAMKVAPALIAGNTIIIKPSEKAPLSSLKVAALFKEAGFPPGVLNVLPGMGPVTGKLLAEHMKIRKIAFTGSVNTGKIVMQMAAASNLKNVTLELGGKSPAVVFADADLERAVHAVEFSIHHNSGQHCQANSRVFVEASIADVFIEKLKELFRSRKIGDPAEKDTFQGPQVDKAQRDRIVTFLEAGKKDGKVVFGGNATTVNGKGYFIQPTIFRDVPADSVVSREEIFGPVIVVNTFTEEAEALEKANDTEFGLFASIYTKDVERALRFAKDMEAGAVGLNCSAPTQGLDMPVGGWKQSGIGREMFMYGLDNFLETKSVYFRYGPGPFG